MGETSRDLKMFINFCYLYSQYGAAIRISTRVRDPLRGEGWIGNS